MAHKFITHRLPAWKRALLIVLALIAEGCAGNAWLESPSDAELPLDPPGRGYPTAILPTGQGTGDSGQRTGDRGQQPGTHSVALNAQQTGSTADAMPVQQTAPTLPQPQPEQRPQNPPPMVPNLAVIPPQLRTQPVQAATAAATTAALVGGNPISEPRSLSRPVARQIADDKSAPSPAGTVEAIGTSAAATTIEAATANIGSMGSIAPSESPLDRQDERLARMDRSRRELIAALEGEIRYRRAQSPTDGELARLEQELRLVYLTAGRLDDAVQAVESLDPAQREAYKHLMFGLGVWLSPDEASRPSLRAGKALKSLRDATAELAVVSKLAIPKLAFCKGVEYFGWYTEFPRYEFQPKQEVLLYAEIENFAAEQKSPAGFETELQGSYQIFDASGRVVAQRQLPLDKEVCRNYRRDYFLVYPIYMPDSIAPGRYRLELTVEDLKAHGKYQGRRLGEGVVEFTIR